MCLGKGRGSYDKLLHHWNTRQMKRKLNISFVLEGWTTRPVGGYKIVYEYANRLARRGHKVNVICPIDISNSRGSLWRGYIRTRRKVATWVRGKWFRFDSSVNFLVPPTLEERHIPDADCVVASDWPTAYRINDYSPQKGKKYYFVQGYETWLGDKDKEIVNRTFKLPLTKIVISQWLLRQMEDIGESAVAVPNAIDTSVYALTNSIEDRDAYALGMLYHTASFKGVADGLKAVGIARETYPQIKLNLFGVYPKPKKTPSWASYARRPGLRELVRLYNNVSIFVHTSEIEGWALTPFEAMACGCAVAATNSQGILDYAEHDNNALISPARSPEQLAANIIRLVEDRDKRISLAKAGNERIRQFSWDKSVDLFEQALASA